MAMNVTNYDDIENHLALHSIKKFFAYKNSVEKPKHTYKEETLPALICNILKSNYENPEVSELNGISYKNLLLYGRVFRKTNMSQKIEFCLDDGTGCIKVCVNRKIVESRYKQILRQFQNEKSEINTPLVDAIEHISRRIEEQLQPYTKSKEYFSNGSGMFVLGKPVLFRRSEASKEIIFYANDCQKDDQVNRDDELFFKRYLIDLYLENKRNLDNYTIIASLKFPSVV